MMKIWKRNAIVAAVLVLVCAGIYLNWRYEEGLKVDLVSTLDSDKVLNDAALVMQTDGEALEALAGADLPASPAADQFARLRLSRQQSRDSAVELLQETISYAGEGEDLSASTAKLDEIVSASLAEASIESLIVSKGYADCVAYMTAEGITVAVPAGESGLQASDVALLSDVILSQTDYELPEIRIIEVK